MKKSWGYILWGLFLILCWFYIGLAFMWIGFYLLVVFGGLSLFSNMAAVRFTKNFTQGRAAGSRLLRWFLFPAAAMTGVALMLLGGYFVWQERPEILQDRVPLSPVAVIPPSSGSFALFTRAWHTLPKLAENPALLGQPNPPEKLLSEYGIIHPELWQRAAEDAQFHSQVIAALKQIPPHPGNKNTYHYMRNFPKYGPIELPAGDKRLVFGAYPYEAGNRVKYEEISWKLEAIIPNSGNPLPDTSPCYFKIICFD